jgi:hypothetical protein
MENHKLLAFVTQPGGDNGGGNWYDAGYITSSQLLSETKYAIT